MVDSELPASEGYESYAYNRTSPPGRLRERALACKIIYCGMDGGEHGGVADGESFGGGIFS